MKRTLVLGVSFLIIAAAAVYAFTPPAASGYIVLLRTDAPLNPLTERFIDSQIGAAQTGGAALIVLDLGTAQGYSSSVGRIADRIRTSRVPVLVRSPVRPATAALDYLAQGAARLEGGQAGLDSLSAGRFIAALNGRAISFHGRTLVLRTDGESVRSFEMNGVARLLAELLNANLAYVLLLIGIIGIAVEFSLPGVGVPGVVGGLALLLSLVGLGALSVNIGGLLLVLLALALFILDIKAPTHGVLTAGGLIALLAGSFLLFPGRSAPPGLQAVSISPVAIVAMSALLSSVVVSAVFLGAQAQRRKIQVGRETLVGRVGVALTDLTPNGTVRVANEEWSAVAVGDEVKAGEEVDVVDVQGVHLLIMRRF